MTLRTGCIAATVLGLVMGAAAVRVTGQTAPQQQTPAAPQEPAAAQIPPQGHGGPTPPGAAAPPRQQRPRFPAQQRPPGDPAVVERGRGLYASACGACHGVDARGGQLGGPNLLRSQLVLNDVDGELILPVVLNGRPGTQMPPIPLPEADVRAIATFLHHLQSQGGNQGDPPPGEEVELDILVGDPRAGERYFAAKCASCHSATGDLQGLANRVTEPVALQNLWVSGGRVGGRRGRGFQAPSERAAVRATVTWPSGEQVTGRLVRIDDFLVTVTTPDGVQRTIRRTGDVPAVQITDPLEGHRALLSVLTDTAMHDVTAYLATLK